MITTPVALTGPVRALALNLSPPGPPGAPRAGEAPAAASAAGRSGASKLPTDSEPGPARPASHGARPQAVAAWPRQRCHDASGPERGSPSLGLGPWGLQQAPGSPADDGALTTGGAPRTRRASTITE
jgi:hypothetical protein